VQRYCSRRCRFLAGAARKRSTPEGARVEQMRAAVWYGANASLQCWRTSLSRSGRLTPERAAVVESLRGRGHIEPAKVRALFAAAGCALPEPVRTPPSRRRVEAPAAPAPVVVAPSPPPSPVAPLEGRWALPSPEAPRLLPCAALDLELTTDVDLGSVRLLHGALSSVHGRGHDRTRPGWRLVPVAPRRWRVLWLDVETAERLRATSDERRIGERADLLAWGATLVRPRSPAPLAAGIYRVTIDTRGPVSFARNEHTEAVTSPGAGTMEAAALRHLALAGVEHGRGVEIREVESRTSPVALHMGGHLYRGAGRGEVIACEGRIVVTCNAVAAWALRLAEVYGLGGLTAFGLGGVSVKVEALP
jgi:hypothetical protein